MNLIAVCDDTPDILELLQDLLEAEGYKVALFDSGAKLLKALPELQPDLLLLDLRLPGEDGFSVLNKASVPTVVFSAKAEREDREQALKLGALDFLEKPFSVTKLLDTLANHLPS